MKNQIKSIEDVKNFVQYLIDNDQLYHFEDDPIDVINTNDEAVFTPYECDLLNKRVDEICELNLLESAFEFALEHLCAEDEAYTQEHRASLTQEQINSI
jgi:hypothetical protein